LKSLKKGGGEIDFGTDIPEFDYATSLTSKDLPKHEF
jgi:hypothetical protein